MRRSSLLVSLSALLALAAPAATASATVIYTFTSGPGPTFTYASPDFVSTDRTVAASQLTAATPTITSVDFLPSCPGGGNPNCDQLTIRRDFSGATIGSSFYFSDGAFVTDGTYTEILFGSAFLTVTGTPSTAVPEPASLALLGTGLLGLGLIRRHRRSAA